jgi:hypothetical protein
MNKTSLNYNNILDIWFVVKLWMKWVNNRPIKTQLTTSTSAWHVKNPHKQIKIETAAYQ